MDSVFQQYLYFYKKELIEKGFLEKKVLDCFPLKQIKSIYNKNINVTEIDENYFFYSNQISKGFYTEKNGFVDNLDFLNLEYKEIQKYFGKITDFFGFKNGFFENLTELFVCDKESCGIGELEPIFLEKSNGQRKIGEINLDNIYTFAYEANGNRFVIDENNNVFLCAHDLGYSNVQPVEGCPKDSFFTLPNIKDINDFVNVFMMDFLS